MKSTETKYVDSLYRPDTIGKIERMCVLRDSGKIDNKGKDAMKYKIFILTLSISLLFQWVYFVGCNFSHHTVEEQASSTQKNEVKVPATDEIRFVAEYETAAETASREARPLLLFFTLPNSASSRKMKETTFRDPEIKRLSTRFVCAELDAMANSELCRRLDIKGFPTVLLISTRGAEIYRFAGTQAISDLTLQMHVAIQSTASKAVVRK